MRISGISRLSLLLACHARAHKHKSTQAHKHKSTGPDLCERVGKEQNMSLHCVCQCLLHYRRLVCLIIWACRAHACALLFVTCICQGSLTSFTETVDGIKFATSAHAHKPYADCLLCSPCPFCSMLCCMERSQGEARRNT